MACRQVRMMDNDQVMRLWLAGEKIQAIARSTSSDRNTVRRIVRLAGEAGIGPETPWPSSQGKAPDHRRIARSASCFARREVSSHCRTGEAWPQQGPGRPSVRDMQRARQADNTEGGVRTTTSE